MKIVLVGPAYPLRGGNALFVAHLYESLASAHNVTVVSYSRLYPQILFPGVRQNDISGAPVKKHPAEALIDSVSPWTWFAAARRIVSLKPDLVVISWWNPFFGFVVATVASRYKRATGRPVVMVAENVISHEGRRVDFFLTRLALRYADYFVVLSEVVERQVKKLYPGRPVLRTTLPLYDCYDGDPSLTSAQAKERLGLRGKNLILFFGYIRAYKGLMNLIEAFSTIRARVADAHLLIVGEFYDDPKPYHEAIRNASMEGNVTIVAEYVANERVHLYFRAADVVALPYNEATQSGILSIAYGFARPVIATDVGGLPELVEDGVTGYVVPANKPQELAEAAAKFFLQKKGDEFSRNILAKNQIKDYHQMRGLFEQIGRELGADRGSSSAMEDR